MMPVFIILFLLIFIFVLVFNYGAHLHERRIQYRNYLSNTETVLDKKRTSPHENRRVKLT